MNRFVKSVVVLSTLLHATLGCHAHHAHAGVTGCKSDSKAIEHNHRGHDHSGHDHRGHDGCEHDQGESQSTESLSNNAPCGHSHFPTEPCSGDCDGACCSWWEGPRGPETPAMAIDLFSLVPTFLDSYTVSPIESPRVNPVSCLFDDHLRRHLSIQILLI